MEQLRAALSARPDREDRPLVASMEALVDIYLANDTVPRFLLRDASHDPERAGWVFDHVSRPLLDHFLPLIRRAQAAGRVSAPIPELFFLSFAYGVAVNVVRRALLTVFAPALAAVGEFRPPLYATLVAPPPRPCCSRRPPHRICLLPPRAPLHAGFSAAPPPTA